MSDMAREIGALAQAARNFLLSHSVDDARTLDRLAATALGCQPIGPPRGVEIEERPCKRCKAEGYVGLDDCSDCGCTGTVSVITYEPDEVRDYYAAMEAAAMVKHPDSCEHGVRLKNHCATCAAIAKAEAR
jgi:hypothetical protein